MESKYKRKIRATLTRLSKIFILFLLTLGILFLGFLFSQAKKHTLVLISPLVQNSHTLFSTITQETIATALAKENIEITTIQISTDASILVTLKTGPVVVFTQSKDIANQIASLQLITSRLTIDGKRPSRIDLRFNTPLVAF